MVGKRTCRSNDDPRCTEPIFVMTNTDTVVHAPLVRSVCLVSLIGAFDVHISYYMCVYLSV